MLCGIVFVFCLLPTLTCTVSEAKFQCQEGKNAFDFLNLSKPANSNLSEVLDINVY